MIEDGEDDEQINDSKAGWCILDHREKVWCKMLRAKYGLHVGDNT